jgi:predicted transcriptional regulator
VGRKPPAAGMAAPKAVPKATTIRLKAELITGLTLLQHILKKPMNRMINEAVRLYVERQSVQVETDLKDVLERIKAYRRSDPSYKKMWDEFVDAEARYGKDDPVEGRIKNAGPVQARVREMLGR